MDHAIIKVVCFKKMKGGSIVRGNAHHDAADARVDEAGDGFVRLVHPLDKIIKRAPEIPG
ncbi:MAG: hypothetical protein ABL977_02890 [Candidatus Eisenbacteria bacterium]